MGLVVLAVVALTVVALTVVALAVVVLTVVFLTVVALTVVFFAAAVLTVIDTEENRYDPLIQNGSGNRELSCSSEKAYNK